jgi:hypothetical protein
MSSSASTTSLCLPRPCCRLRLCLLGSGKTGVCLHPGHAPGSGKTRDVPRPRRLRLHRLRHRHPSSTTASTRLFFPPYALCACGFMCGYLDTGTQPRHRPRHPLTWLPRPRLQHPPLSATSTSAQGLSPRMIPHQLLLQSKHLRLNSVHDVSTPNAGMGVVSPLVSTPWVSLQSELP